MRQDEIAIGIIAGTIVIFILIVFIILLVVRLSKRIREHHALKVNYETLAQHHAAQQNYIKELEADLKGYALLREQLPKTPLRMLIKYYKEWKYVDVHALIHSIGIAVICDPGQMNYRIKMIDELEDEGAVKDAIIQENMQGEIPNKYKDAEKLIGTPPHKLQPKEAAMLLELRQYISLSAYSTEEWDMIKKKSEELV